MKKIASIVLLSLTNISFLLSSQAARADQIVCHPVNDNQVSRNWADRPQAYADGYREGEQSFRDGVAYKPQTAGGEFARGFEDGYFNHRYSGRSPEQNLTPEKCHESDYETLTPPVIYYPYVVAPPVYYNYPLFYNYPSINFGFGFGGWNHGWGYHRWGHYGRW